MQETGTPNRGLQAFEAINWVNCLAVPFPPITRPVAWDRVSVPSHPDSERRGLPIMKRVGLVTRHTVPQTSTPIHDDDFITYFDEPCRYPRRRLSSDLPSFAYQDESAPAQPTDEEEVEVTEGLMTDAEITHSYATAKVAVANHHLANQAPGTKVSFQNWQQARTGSWDEELNTSFAGSKRLFNGSFSSLSRNHPLQVFTSIIPLLRYAERTEKTSLSLKDQTIFESGLILRNMSRNPRQLLAAEGQPDTSTIFDVTEPESPTMHRVNENRAETRSPTKRVAKLDEARQTHLPRLADTFIELPPSTAAQVQPSPVKSSSPPSTPARPSPSPEQDAYTGTLIHSSPLSRAALLAPEDLSPNPSIGPTLKFQVPSESSYESSHSNMDKTALAPKDGAAPSESFINTSSGLIAPEPSALPEDSSIHNAGSPVSSPVKRPVAPTPSRWYRAEPKTPMTSTPLGIAYGNVDDSPIGLAALGASLTPTPIRSDIRFETPEKAPEIDFGNRSTSFSGTPSAVLTPSEARRVSNIAAARRRRRSEPLYLRAAKLRARRQSAGTEMPDIQRHTDGENPATPAPIAASSVVATPIVATQQETSPIEATPRVLAPIASNTETVTPIVTDTQGSTPIVSDLNATTPTVVGRSMATPIVATPMARNTDVPSIVNIDMRMNPNIFGVGRPTDQMVSPKSKEAKIGDLAKLAEDRCAGQAKVLTGLERGRLVVRFKLPPEYAHMFPDPQGFDESRFTTTPSAISSSPRIRFPNTVVSQEAVAQTPTSQSMDLDSPAVIGSGSSAISIRDETVDLATPTMTGTGYGQWLAQSPLAPRDENIPRYSAVHESPSVEHPSESLHRSADLSDVFITRPEDQDRTMNLQELGLTGFSQVEAETSPALNTPARNAEEDRTLNVQELGVGDFSNVGPATLDETHTHTPAATSEDVSMGATAASFHAAVEGVESSNDKPEEAMTEDHRSTPQTQAASTVPEEIVTQSSRVIDDDSPGRDYIADFIKRSRPKRLSTTETGSPIALPSNRQPLGAKSPNAGSPRKTKRKADDGEEAQSPVKRLKEPAPKRPKRSTGISRKQANLRIDMKIDLPETANEDEAAEKAEGDETEEGGPVTRRSTRLRSRKTAPSGTKSSLPTPIALNRPETDRVGGAVLNPAVRSLMSQTRENTRRNRGDQQPKELLVSRAESLQSEESDGSSQGSNETTRSTKNGNRKTVAWGEPLERVQEEQPREEEPAPQVTKKLAIPKARTTKPKQGQSGIAKPRVPVKRSAKVAEGLGMAGNGTPARPTRSTRARTRSQK